MGRDPSDQLHHLHDQCEAHLNEGEISAALKCAKEAHALAEQHRDHLDRDDLLDTEFLFVEALLAADAPDQALRHCEAIREIAPKDEELPLVEGMALLQLCRFDEARESLERCELSGSRGAETLWHLAVVAEFLDEFDRAERLYAQANRLDADLAPLPVRMTADQVQALLTEVVEDLPDQIREVLGNVVMEIEPLPKVSLLREEDPPFSPFILGLHIGTSWADKSVFASEGSIDRILIFQRNIERIAHSPEMLREQLCITLLHEIGHHLGWDEDDLERRGLA